MYDGALLKNASDPMDGEVRLYLRAAPSQSVCICAPEPEARMTPEDYCAAQLTAIRTTLGNRLKEEEKRSVSGKLGDWNGASYRYDVDGEKFSLREEMFADRDGKLLNLYFYAGDGTSEALREAAELVMQSAEQLP